MSFFAPKGGPTYVVEVLGRKRGKSKFFKEKQAQKRTQSGVETQGK
ncbi:MAG: hypothetical protein ACMUEL_02000 [Flavobacteriales bacterium Tduv]